jgi:multiple sugar transport system permease protein
VAGTVDRAGHRLRPEENRMRQKRNWAPYILILPSAVFLAVFFAWPMFRALTLAVWDDDGRLTLREEAQQASAVSGSLPQNASVKLLERQGNLIPPEEVDPATMQTERWFRVTAEDASGAAVEGWVPETRIRVREEADDGTPLSGTVRRVLASDADPQTSVFAEPRGGSEIIAKLEANTAVTIAESALLEVWFRLEGEAGGTTVTGWAPSRYLQVFGEGETGRIDRGNSGLFTLEYLSRMVNDRFFGPALWTTLLLTVLIIPVQFVLAVIMALVIQARLRGNEWFLYIFAIPLGVSDLAVGIVWYAVFTQFGYLNTILQSLGLIDAPITYLSANTRHWIITAIWLAEVWRATSIVMVIVVSGLQAISDEVLEAAELFGANLWQRIRHVILPLLKPSLQVALILRTILALQVFAVVVALSGGDIVTVLANETFRQYYEFRNPNVAAAYAGFILLLSMITSVLYLRLVRSQEEATA